MPTIRSQISRFRGYCCLGLIGCALSNAATFADDSKELSLDNLWPVGLPKPASDATDCPTPGRLNFPRNQTPSSPAIPCPNPTPISPKNDNAPNTDNAPAANAPDLSFLNRGGDQVAQSGDSFSAPAPGGYLDNPVPVTMFRIRYDAAGGMNRTDRDGYFYADCGALNNQPVSVRGTSKIFTDSNAKGPIFGSGNLSYQETSAYFEYAFSRRFSAFVDAPFRFVDFTNIGSTLGNTGGLGDVQLGFKAAFLADPDQYLTGQFRTYLPTGDAALGLGTGHVSLEPSLLYYQRLTNRLIVQGQLTDWIPVNGGPITGNVLSYGAGVGYDVYQSSRLRIMPITEFVGWTALNGYETVLGNFNVPGLPTGFGVKDVSGETIVNAKFGVRTYFGDGHDLYVGYGHCLTGDRWYSQILRIEYRRSW